MGDAASAVRTMLDLQSDPARREKMARAALAFAQAHRGATERAIELIDDVLSAAVAAAVEGRR